VVRDDVGDHAGVGRTGCICEELDPEISDEELRVAARGHHDPEPDQVEDRADEDDGTPSSPRRVDIVGQLPHQWRHADREDGSGADHQAQGCAERGMRNIGEVAKLALDEDEPDRQPVEVETEPEARERRVPGPAEV